MIRGLSAITYSFCLGWRGMWNNPIALGSVMFAYLVGKGLWASVWSMVPESTFDRLSAAYGPLVWYAMLTGLVNYPVVRLFRAIEDDIRNGTIASFLVHPVGYLPLKVGEWSGGSLARLVMLIPACVALAYGVTGYWPFTSVAQAIGYALSSLLGSFLWIIIHTLIGLSTMWVSSPRTIFQLVSKGVLILGGVVLPIHYYPVWVQYLVWCTPFPALLYIPAHQAIEPVGLAWFGWISLQVFWIGVALVLAKLGYRQLQKHLLTQGGM